MLDSDDPDPLSPTIQQFEDDPHATAFNEVLVPGSETADHEVPSHCSNVPEVAVTSPGPTAQQAESEVHATELSPPAVGVDAVDQLVPSHATTKAWGAGLLVLELSVPTAQQSDELTQVTELRALPS